MQASMQNITLARTDRHWLFTWQPVGAAHAYFINQENIRYNPAFRDLARNAFNACYAGLLVRVRGSYNNLIDPDLSRRKLRLDPRAVGDVVRKLGFNKWERKKDGNYYLIGRTVLIRYAARLGIELSERPRVEQPHEVNGLFTRLRRRVLNTLSYSKYARRRAYMKE